MSESSSYRIPYIRHNSPLALETSAYLFGRSLVKPEISDATVKEFVMNAKGLIQSLNSYNQAKAMQALIEIYAFWSNASIELRNMIDWSPMLHSFLRSVGNNGDFHKFERSLPPTPSKEITFGKQILFVILEGVDPDNYVVKDRIELTFREYIGHLPLREQESIYKEVSSYVKSLPPHDRLYAIRFILTYMRIYDMLRHPSTRSSNLTQKFLDNFANAKALENFKAHYEHMFDEQDTSPEQLATLVQVKEIIERIVSTQVQNLTGAHLEAAYILIKEILINEYRKRKDINFAKTFNNRQRNAYFELVMACRSNRRFEKYLLHHDDTILKAKFRDTKETVTFGRLTGKMHREFKPLPHGYDSLGSEDKDVVLTIYELSPKVYDLARTGLFTTDQLAQFTFTFEALKDIASRNGVSKFLDRINKQDPRVIFMDYLIDLSRYLQYSRLPPIQSFAEKVFYFSRHFNVIESPRSSHIRRFAAATYNLSRSEGEKGNPFLDLLESKEMKKMLNYVIEELQLLVEISIDPVEGYHYVEINSRRTKASVRIVIPVKQMLDADRLDLAFALRGNPMLA